MIVAVITVMVTHHQYALKISNLSDSKNRVIRDYFSSPGSDISLFLHQVTSVGPYRFESNTYDSCCNHSSGYTSPACLKNIYLFRQQE